jgi:hypothetical protein
MRFRVHVGLRPAREPKALRLQTGWLRGNERGCRSQSGKRLDGCGLEAEPAIDVYQTPLRLKQAQPGGGVMKNFRFRYETRRAHVHVRLFSGRALHKTHGKNGGLVFSADEWDQFVGCLRAHVKWCTKTRSARRRAAAAGLASAKATGAQVGT